MEGKKQWVHRPAHGHKQCKGDTQVLHRLPCRHKQPRVSCSHSQAATLTAAAGLHAARTGAHLLFLRVMKAINGHKVLNSTGSEPVRLLSA